MIFWLALVEDCVSGDHEIMLWRSHIRVEKTESRYCLVDTILSPLTCLTCSVLLFVDEYDMDTFVWAFRVRRYSEMKVILHREGKV